MGATFSAMIDQGWPPAPTFEEKDVEDQQGRVYIVTGAATGVGFQLAKILYSKNAKVYIAGRSEKNGNTAIAALKAEFKNSDGELIFLQVDLGDLTTLKASAQEFLSKEKRLDGIVHNAGVMVPPSDWKTTQGWELQFGTNVLGPFVLQKYLDDILIATAKIAPKNTVRVVWVSSFAGWMAMPGGVDYECLEVKGAKILSRSGGDSQFKYAQSKYGNNALASAYAKKFGDTGVLSYSLNPGNLKSDLQRHSFMATYLIFWMLHPPRFGGLTELYALLSPTLTKENNGAVIKPWGRIDPFRPDLVEDWAKGEDIKLWEWIDEHTKEY